MKEAKRRKEVEEEAGMAKAKKRGFPPKSKCAHSRQLAKVIT